MSIVTQQMRLSNRAVNGRDIDIGEMFGNEHAVTLSQQRLSDESKKTSGYYAGSIQGGSDNRRNLYPDNNTPFITVNTNYKGFEIILPVKPPPETGRGDRRTTTGALDDDGVVTDD